MTYRCNHACLFCSCPWYADGFERKPELTACEWKCVIRRLSTMGVCNIAFTGGEPLLKEGIEEIVSFAANTAVEHVETEDGELKSWHAPPKLYLLSNGKAMNHRILGLCERYDINLSMSLPGLTTFEEHTAGGTPAQHILDWFSRARDRGVPTTVGVTVTSRNVHELYETISAALLAGADNLLMNRFLPGGRGLMHRGLALSLEQITEMLDTAEEVLRTANRDGSVGTELPRCVVDESRYERLKVGTRCSAALDFFVIGPSGHVRVCNHSPVRLCHVDSVNALKTHPYWKRFVMKDYLPRACSGCPRMLGCDGGCREAAHIAAGAVDAPDPLLAAGAPPPEPA